MPGADLSESREARHARGGGGDSGDVLARRCTPVLDTGPLEVCFTRRGQVNSTLKKARIFSPQRPQKSRLKVRMSRTRDSYKSTGR